MRRFSTIICVLAACMAFPGAVQAMENPTTAGTLKAFLEQHFEKVGTSCLPDRSRNRRWWPPFRSSSPSQPPSYIPADIKEWSTLEDRMGGPVEVRNTQSMNSVFAEVFLRPQANGATPTRVGQEIGVTWGAPSDPILYQQVSNARREHNCVTLLGGNAEVTASLPIASLRAVLEATTTNQRSQTVFLYGGVMVSPIAASLGLNTTAVEAPSGVSAFSVGMAIWAWYQRHAGQIPAAGQGELVIRNQVEGVALYRVTGLTQSTLLSATGSGGVSLSLFGAQADISASASSEVRSLRRDYAAAFWNGDNTTFVALPPPAVIIQQVQALAVFTPIIDPGVAVTSDETLMNFSADLADMPSAYCKPSFWELQDRSTPPPDASTGTTSNLRVAPVIGAPRVCRFTVSVRPPEKDTSRPSMGVVIAVRTAGGAAPVNNILLQAARMTIPDFRADIALARGAGDLTVSFPASGQPSPLVVGYEIRTQGSRTVESIGETALVSITCGGVTRSQLLRRDTDIKLIENDTVVEVTLRLPAGAIPATPSSGVPCSLEGEVKLRTDDEDDLIAPLPTYAFTATRAAAAPPAAASNAGSAPVPVAPG